MSKLVATAHMLIRKPPKDIFEAFSEPRWLELFWLKRASAPLAENAIVEWEFLVPGARETVTVTEFLANRVIAFSWSDGVLVTIKLIAHAASCTRVSIAATGFKGMHAVSQAINATEGFAVVLCDLKSLLETGSSGNMVRDKAALIGADIADI
ncbi:MAG: polyketide cyclase [Pseudomonadota bacterium]